MMIQLCRCLFGLSYLALYVLLCDQLFGWMATLLIMSVQLFLAGWLIWAMIRAPD
ncbi:hypothetical protein PZH42_16530 [Bacteroides cellulosilyticus]|uniref:Uncharacterized protein n=1 Tax=Bacteroides cellulosilyticus TaxID=246787 RepID=A0AAW6M935_9BACE|nr:hypothetical protein [Bacteroides cellulosilyticus]MDE8695717.1 hypothetical protein [Bacteroides cellulosilyticus]